MRLGRDSSVGTAGRAEDRMPVGGEIFRKVETERGAHPASSM